MNEPSQKPYPTFTAKCVAATHAWLGTASNLALCRPCGDTAHSTTAIVTVWFYASPASSKPWLIFASNGESLRCSITSSRRMIKSLAGLPAIIFLASRNLSLRLWR